MNTIVVRFVSGRESVKFILLLLIFWFSTHPEAAFAQLLRPKATTLDATKVDASSATLNGVVNAGGLTTTVEFEYGVTTSYGNSATATQSPVNGLRPVDVSAEIAGLLPNTTYHYRVVARNGLGIDADDDVMFTTNAPPTVTTNAPTKVGAASATLNGVVNANGLSTTVKFEYGTTTSYGITVAATPNLVEDRNPILVSAEITGLFPNTLYYYRVVATNQVGTSNGANETFTTGGAPTATTIEAKDINSTSATLNGEVNANRLSTVVEFQYGRTTSYDSTVTARQSPVTGAEPTSLSVIVANLSPGTMYHYRVAASNDGGTTYGDDETFTTEGAAPTVITSGATKISATSAILNGVVSANGLSTTIEFEYGTTTSYGETVSASQSPVSGTDTLAVSVEISGLSPNTAYHYRVVASNLAGRKYGADTTFTTVMTGAAPTATTIATSEACSTSATLHGIVNANGLNTTVIFEYGATTSYGDTAAAMQSPLNGTNPVQVSAAIENLSSGVVYHFRVVAANDAGTSRGDDQVWMTYSSAFNLSTIVNFPSYGSTSDYKTTEYRLVGLPGASNRAVNEFFAGRQNEDWEVVWDNGDANNAFVRFNGSDDFKFSVGRAFWVIKKGPLEIDTTALSAPLELCQFVSIPLDSGWNLITNPFTTPVQWTAIESANGGILQPIYSYNAGFDTSSSLDPYVGYYFFNATNFSTLNIPYPASSSASSARNVDPAIWRVNVALVSGGFIDKITSFGIAGEAGFGLDPLDFRKPRAIAATPTVSFHRPSWDVEYSAFATDIRPEIVESDSWEFEVRATPGVNAHLTFSGIDKIPAGDEIYLIDEGSARAINLRDDSLYVFTPVAEISKFSVVVGKKDAVEEKLNDVALPKEFVLGQNYPNPFNPETTIPVSVPSSAETKLVIYNILGREVKTIHNGTLQAGRYWFTWEGKDDADNSVASGVYFYHLTSNTSVSLMGKMLIIK